MIDPKFIIKKESGNAYIKVDFFRQSGLGVNYTKLGETKRLSTLSYQDHTTHEGECKPVLVKTTFPHTACAFQVAELQSFFTAIKNGFIIGAQGCKSLTAYQERVNKILDDLSSI